jgi:hypothetical protein
MTERIWDKFLTDRDKAVFAAGAVDAIEVCFKFQMLQDPACESGSLRRRQVDSQSGFLHFFKGATNSRIRLASEQANFHVVLTIGRYRFTDPVVPYGCRKTFIMSSSGGPMVTLRG